MHFKISMSGKGRRVAARIQSDPFYGMMKTRVMRWVFQGHVFFSAIAGLRTASFAALRKTDMRWWSAAADRFFGGASPAAGGDAGDGDRARNGGFSGLLVGERGMVVPSHFALLAAPGLIWKGLRWMFDPESPFSIRPLPSRDLFRGDGYAVFHAVPGR
jgi:hypothetical protein